MTFDDLGTWRVIYSQFVGADSKYGISFALNNNKAQDSCKVRIIMAESHRKWPMARMALRDFNLRSTVYGS